MDDPQPLPAGSQIRIPKAAELVAATLRDRIVLRHYQPDELLPPESTIMADFGVARTTVRDAFRVLESEGLLEVRRGAGGGARVKAPAVRMLVSYAALLLQFQGATLADVHEGRALIEAPAAGMLAQQRGADGVSGALRSALEDEQQAETTEDLTRAEGRFHQLVIELTGNSVLKMMSAVTNRLIAEQVARAVRHPVPATRAGFIAARRAHLKLVELIEAGDSLGAQQLWRRHITSGGRNLEAAGPTAAIDLLP